jgi:hypothetical protein
VASEAPSSEPTAPAVESPAADDADVRDQVRRAVEQLKAELQDRESEGAQATAASLDETVVESEASAPAAGGEASQGAEMAGEAESEEDLREKVRRAVIEARADLDGGVTRDREDNVTPESASALEARIPHYEALLDKNFLAPASIIIEDPEGRVELVRVYRTLARLECAATANLANYSSHSVTVQMEERNLPLEQDILDAVTYAFERECSIDIDGNRANVLLSGTGTRAA